MNDSKLAFLVYTGKVEKIHSLSHPFSARGLYGNSISELIVDLFDLVPTGYSTSNVSLGYNRPNRIVFPIAKVQLNRTTVPDWIQWVSLAISVFLFIRIFIKVRNAIVLRRFAHQNGCLPMRLAPNPFGGKIRRYFEFAKVDANILDDYLLAKFNRIGLTHGLASFWTGRIKGIATVEPENFQAVLATKFDDWERPLFRAKAIKPLLGPGILTLVSFIK
jgi:hypothetical protein